jgi:hypothetical protein
LSGAVALGLGLCLSQGQSSKSTSAEIAKKRRAPSLEKKDTPRGGVVLREPSGGKPKGNANSGQLLRSVLQSAQARYQQLESCYQENCDFSSEDPRAYDLAVQKAQSGTLLAVVKQLYSTQQVSAEASALAIKVMKSESPFVQQRALEILSTQPPSSQALQVVISEGLTSTSPKVVSMSMDELLKYVGTSLEPLAHEQISKALRISDRITVGHMLSRLDPFIHKLSYATYEGLQGHLAFPDQNRRLSGLLMAASERI